MAFVFKQQYDSFTEQQMRNFFLTLSEKDRRRYAALEAIKLGHGASEYIASLFGCSRRTIEKAIAEVRELTKLYEIGRKATQEFRDNISIQFDSVLPRWNYVAQPQ